MKKPKIKLAVSRINHANYIFAYVTIGFDVLDYFGDRDSFIIGIKKESEDQERNQYEEDTKSL